MNTESKAQKYRTILENAIPHIFFTHSFPDKNSFRTTNLEFVNPSLLDAVGFSSGIPDYFLGKTLEEFISEIFADKEAARAYLQSLETNGQVENRELRLRRSDGSAFWVQATARIRSTEEGFYLQGIFVNLERVKALEEALTKEKKTLEMILSGIGDAVCIYDRDCKIIFQSDRHKRIFGEAVGQMCLYALEHEKEVEESRDPVHWLEKKTGEDGMDRFYQITAFPRSEEHTS